MPSGNSIIRASVTAILPEPRRESGSPARPATSMRPRSRPSLPATGCFVSALGAWPAATNRPKPMFAHARCTSQPSVRSNIPRAAMRPPYMPAERSSSRTRPVSDSKSRSPWMSVARRPRACTWSNCRPMLPAGSPPTVVMSKRSSPSIWSNVTPPLNRAFAMPRSPITETRLLPSRGTSMRSRIASVHTADPALNSMASSERRALLGMSARSDSESFVADALMVSCPTRVLDSVGPSAPSIDRCPWSNVRSRASTFSPCGPANRAPTRRRTSNGRSLRSPRIHDGSTTTSHEPPVRVPGSSTCASIAPCRRQSRRISSAAVAPDASRPQRTSGLPRESAVTCARKSGCAPMMTPPASMRSGVSSVSGPRRSTESRRSSPLR